MNLFKNNQINSLKFFSLLRFSQFLSMILTAPWQLFPMTWPTQSKSITVIGTVLKDGLFCSSDINLHTLGEHFKTFDAHLPVFHSIFLYNKPELYADRINPHIAVLNRIAERILEANAKFIRGKSGLVIAEIYFLNLNTVRFAPLSGSAWTPLPKFLQNK